MKLHCSLALLISLLSAGAASIPAQIKASHGIDGATLQTRFDTLSKQGYQVISISVYGSPSSARYAAVFRKQTGPARRTFWNRKRDSFLTSKNSGPLRATSSS